MSSQWSSQESATWEGSSESSSTAETAKSEAGNLAQTSKQGVGQVAGTAKEQGQEVLSEAASQAKNLIGETRSKVTGQASEQQQRAASNLRLLSDELRSMAEISGSSGTGAHLVRQASEQVQQVAGWLESRDPSGVLEEARNFARRKPGTFLAGAAVAGLLAGRATRTGVELKRESSSSDSGSEAVGYATTTTTLPPVVPEQPGYVGGATGTGYASAGTYASDTYAEGDADTAGQAGGTYPNETSSSEEPQR